MKKDFIQIIVTLFFMVTVTVLSFGCGSGGAGSESTSTTSTSTTSTTSTSSGTDTDTKTNSVETITIKTQYDNIEASDDSSTVITASVINSSRSPVPGVIVQFTTTAGIIGVPVETDNDGVASVTLKAEDSLTDITAKVQAHVNQIVYSNVLNITFTATKKYVTGRAYDSSGRPIANASVVAFSEYTQTVTTDDNGFYQMWLPEGDHTVIISHPDFTESYQGIKITEEDEKVESDGLLIASNVSPTGHSFTKEKTFISNIIDGIYYAELKIPVQNPTAVVVNNQKTTTADIAIEYFETEQILPVPLPNATNYENSSFVDGQSPSVIVSVKPGTLKLNNDATLTLPNPDKLTSTNNSILHYIPDQHIWVSLEPLDGTGLSQSIQITEGGIYGIFFDEEEKNEFTLVQGYTENPNSFVFIGDKVIKSNDNGYFSAKVYQPKTGQNVKAYVYDPVSQNISELSVNTNGGTDKPIDAFVASMSLSADPSSIHADKKSSAIITALLKNWNNNPVIGVDVKFQTTDGTIEYSATTDKKGRASVSLFSSEKSHDVTVSAKYSTYEDDVLVKFVDPPSAAPSSISIDLSHSVLQTIPETSFPNSAYITAYISDINSNPIKDGTPVTFNTSIGDIDINTEGVQTSVTAYSSKGTAIARLTSPNNSVGVAVITISAGNINEQTNITISPGPVRHIRFSNTRFNLTADGESQITLTALVTDENGNPSIDGETITFLNNVPLGEMGNLSSKTISTQNGKASVIFTAGSKSGNLVITAISQSNVITSDNTIEINLKNAPIVKIVLDTEALTLEPNMSCSLTATLYNQNNSLINYDRKISFSTTKGDIDDKKSPRAGVQQIVDIMSHEGLAHAVLTSPSNIQGLATVSVMVDEQSDSVDIQFVPGEVYRILLSASPETIKGDGKSQSIISANVTDRNGNIVLDGEPIHFGSTDGAIDITASTLGGTASFIYISSKGAKTITVSATSENGQSAETNIFQTSTLPKYMSLSVSQVTVKSDNSDQSMITAIIKDESHTIVPDITIVFGAEGGQLLRGKDSTDNQGQATTVFSSGTDDKTNREIIVFAEVEGVTPPIRREIPIQIVGSNVTLSTDNMVITQDGNIKANLKAIAKDAGNVPVYDVPLQFSIKSENSNVASVLLTINGVQYDESELKGIQIPVKTNTVGAVDITVSGIKGTGADAVNVDVAVCALGYTAIQTYEVIQEEGYTVDFTIPEKDNNTFIVGSDPFILEVSARPNSTLVFSTSVGEFTNGQKIKALQTNEFGKVITGFSSSVAGLASIQVYDQDNPSISDSIKIAISQPAYKAEQLILQANPTVIPLSTEANKNSSEIIATVLTSLESGSQVVGNANVIFSIEKSTGGGEFIEPVSVLTDNSGTARSTFTSGSLSSDAQGLTIIAQVVRDTNNDGEEDIVQQSEINIKIGGSIASMSIGTATESKILNPTTYATPMSIIVSDANGNRMPNTNISLSLWPVKYSTGYWQEEPECEPVITGTFPNEDMNMNLIMDVNEDLNNDGQLTPPSSAAGNVPSSVSTDENGVANFDLVFLKSNSVWIVNRLEASTVVHGSATKETLEFRLPYVISDACFMDASHFSNSNAVQRLETISLKSTSESIIADGKSNIVLTARLLDHNENSITDNQEIIFSTTGGCLATASTVSLDNNDCLQSLSVMNDGGVVQAKLFSAKKIGKITVTATASNSVNSVIGPISFDPGPPNRIIIIPGVTALNADGESTADIRINVLDQTGNPVADGESIQLAVKYGNLDRFVDQTKDSLVTFSYLAPGSISAETYEMITVTTTNNISETSRILLKPFVRSINVMNERTTIPSDESALITATVRDSKENPMANISIVFQTSAGNIGPKDDVIETLVYKITDENGHARVRFSPINHFTGKATIEIKAGDVTRETVMTVAPGPVYEIAQLSAEPALLEADNQSTSEISARILDQRGNPVSDGQLILFEVIGTNAKLVPSNGLVSTKDGNVSVVYTASSDQGQITIQVNSVSYPNIFSNIFINQVQAPISSVTVSSSEALILAGETCSITAHIKDAGGQYILSESIVTFKTTIGDLDINKPGVQNAIMVKSKNGIASTQLKAPTNILGDITIQALLDNFSGNASTDLTIIPGPIAHIYLTATPDIIESNGTGESIISAKASDSHGNLVADGESILFSKTGGGHLSAPGGSTIDGIALVQLIADSSASMVTIVASSESRDVSDTIFVSISRIFPAKMSISTSQTSVKSDNSDQAVISVIVLDESNFVLPGVKVFFNATGGQLKIESDTTDEDGKATAIFKSGTVDRDNHTVAITANINGLSPVQIPIRITGSIVTLEADNTNITVPSGASNLTQIVSQLKITVKDAGGVPVYNTPISFKWDPNILKISDVSGELLPSSTRKTDVAGQYLCKVEGKNKQDEVKLTVSALNFTAEQIYKVSSPGDAFAIVSPETSPYQLSVDKPLAIQVMSGPAGVTTVVFSASIGTFENNENVYEVAVPQGEDIVQTNYQASMAGLTTIQVYDKYREHISDSLQVAVTQPTEKAGKLLLQSKALVVSPSSGGTLNSVSLKATVKTSNNQVVGNAPVVFTIVNPTGGGESISPVIAFTNETGVAETILTSGSLSSGNDGVVIRASIVGQTNITDSVKIVIGGVVGSISIGVGTTVTDFNSTTYSLPMSILVSDANGNSVPGAVVTLGTWPVKYNTGAWGANVVYDNEGKVQTLDPPCRYYITGTFDNEDINRNLLLDEGEDLNHDGQLTPPNSAAGNLPAKVVTDDSGVANFNLVYLKMNGIWVETEISASTVVHGTETLSSVSFKLRVAVSDVCHLAPSPYDPPDDGTLSGQIERIMISATPDTLIADGRSKSQIDVIVTDEEGYPVIDGELIRFAITEGKGTLSSTSTNTSSGQGSIIFTAPANGTLATRTIITASSGSGSVSETIIISLIPAYIEMNAIPPNIPADGVTQSMVSAVLKNGNNNPVIGEEVKFSTSLGIVQSSGITDEFGKATVVLVSSKTFGTAIVTAEYCGYTQTLPVVFEKLPADPIPAKVSLATSQVSIKSDNLEQATITAIVLDKYNSVLPNINVIFRASDGQLSSSSVKTDKNGNAITTFKSGAHDKTNRTVTITAETGGLTPVQIPIVITGSHVDLNADNTSITLPSPTPGLYTEISSVLEINVSDAGGQGVFNTPINLSWEGNGDVNIIDPLSIGIMTTDGFKIWSDVTGKASVIVQGKQSGSVVIKAHALGFTASKSFNVSAPGFAFGIVTPTDDPYSLEVDQSENIIVRGGPPDTYTIVFSTTSGVFENNESVIEKVSSSDGLAKAVFHSNKAGMATIQVFNKGQYVTSDSVKIAIYQPIQKASKILLQSSSNSVPVSNGDTQNTIVIRATILTDYTSNNQVVGNAPVIFSIVNPTGGGEYVSPVIAYTDETGIATTRFTSGSLGSTADGVIVEAAILNMASIKEQIKIVIGGVAGSVAIGRGTSNDIVKVGTSAYALPMSVLVADANGNRIAGALVSLNAWPGKYHTGYWKSNIVYDHSGKPYTLDPPCLPVRTQEFPNEDINENLFKDPGEDTNNDGELTPPNSAAGNLPSKVMTDENGVANFELVYLKGSAAWITDRIQASTFVHGTETVSSISFVLPYLYEDVCNLSNSPFVNFTGAVNSIAVSASQSYLIAGHDCIISALIKNDEGKVISDGTTVYFVTSGGDINHSLPGVQPTFSAETVNGIASATLVSPLDNLSPIEVTVRSGDFSDSIYVDIVSVPPSKISLSTSKIAVNSNNSDYAIITAIVLDENNSVLPGVNVSFHTSSGQLSSGFSTTDDNGMVNLHFSSGTHDQSNRTATITAKAEGLTPVQIPVLITGSTIEIISEKSNLTVDQGGQDDSHVTDQLKISVLDSGNMPVFGAAVLINVENSGSRNIDMQISTNTNDESVQYTSIFSNETIKTAMVQTDVLGQVKLKVIGKIAGETIVKATALGVSTSTNYKISLQGEEFGIIYPETDIHSAYVDEPLMLTVRAGSGNVNTIVFSTTSGFFDLSENNVVDVSVVNGHATATLQSKVAGLATIQVYDKNNYQTSDSLKVAFSQPKNKADKILFQSSASSLPVSIGNIENTITLKATVLTDYTSGRQVVEDVPVLFSIENPTGGGEFISPVIVITNQAGIASTRFTSGSLGSSAEGVVVKATLINKPEIESSIKIVIGGVAGSVAIGRGSSLDIVSLNPSTYALPMSVLVSDANGNRMANAQVSLSAWPVKYSTGYWGADPFQGNSSNLLCSPNILGTYDNEDINENIYLDPGEDINSDGELTPPNAAAGNLPSSVTTDENGVANFNLVYLKSSAVWITNRIQATTYVHGTETRSSVTFSLPYVTSESCDMPNAPYVNLTGSVKSLSLTPEREYLVAGNSCNVEVTVYDDENKPISGNTSVTFESSSGDIDPIIPGVQSKKIVVTQGGKADIQLISPSNQVGVITIVAEASGITTDTNIEIIPGDMASIKLTATPNNLTADGESIAQIVTQVRDQFGNPVIDGEVLDFVKMGDADGILSKSSGTTKDGKIELTYQAASVSGSVTIRAVSRTYTHITDEIVIPLIRADVGSVLIESNNYILNAYDTTPSNTSSYSAILSITVKKENEELVEDGTLVTIETTIGDLDLISKPVTGTQSKVMAATQNGIARVVLTSPNNIIGEAEVLATAGGVSSEAKISIVPGPVAHISINAKPENLTADGKSQSQIQALVTDKNGNPVVNGETVIFEVSGMGMLSTTGKLGSGTTIDGYAEIIYTAPSVPGTVTISATCGSNNTVTDFIKLSLVKASVGSVDVTSDESFLMADGSSFTFVHATVKDEAGNLVANGTAVTFSTNLGDLDQTDNVQAGVQSTVTVETIDGVATARLTSPPKVIGTALATITATVGGVPGTTSINIVVGPVAKINLSVDDNVLVANGSDSIQIRADVTDANNNAVADGERVNFVITQPNGSSSTQYAFTTSGVCSIIYLAGTQTGNVQIQAFAANNSSVTDNLSLSLVERVAMIQLVATPLELSADGKSRSEISAYVIDGKGDAAANGEKISFAILHGSGSFPFGNENMTSGGKATVSFMASEIPGSVTIIASSENTITDVIVLTLTGTDTITLENSHPYLIADGSHSMITATFTDKTGISVPDGTFITFDTTMGDIDDINNIRVGVQKEVRVSTVNGQVVVRLTSPTNMIGTAKITAQSDSIRSELDINIVPGPANWIQLSATPDNLNADGLSTGTINAVVTDIHGNRIVDGETIYFKLKDNNGRLSANTGSTINGETSVIYTAGYTEGTATIEAWSDSYSHIRQTVSIVLIDSEIKVESITLNAEKDSIIADGSSCWIMATIRDKSGNIVEDGARVSFSTSLGDLDPYSQTVIGIQRSIIVETLNGQARIRFVSPTNELGTASIIATIGGVSQILDLQIIAGLPKNVVVSATPNNLFADGMSTSVIKALVSDAYGNTVVDGETVTFTLSGSGRFATTGYTQATASTKSGIASVSYIAGSIVGVDTITAKANSTGISRSIPVTLINGDIEIDSVILYAEKTILTAGGYTCVIRATVKDQDENFITDGTMVTFNTTIGDIDHTLIGTQQIISTPTVNGQAAVILTTPTNILGNAKVMVTVGGKTAEQTIAVIPGPVAQINLSVTSNADEITTSAASETFINAKVKDANGNNVVDGETIVFTIDIKGGETNKYTASTMDGIAQMTYYLSSSAETLVITATSVSTHVKASKAINLVDPNVIMPSEMSISTDNQTIKSDNTDVAIITAIVLDNNYAVLSGVTVNFSANGGLLSHGSSVTNSLGEATVRFSSGNLDKQNRIITITATVEGIEKSIPIQIVGSTINVSCDKTSVTDDGSSVASCQATVRDAGSQTIYNTPVTFSTGMTSNNDLSSAILISFLGETGETPYTFASGNSGVYSAANGNLGSYTVLTNINGQVNFKIQGIEDKIGSSMIVFKALGDQKQQEFVINKPSNAFGIIETSPAKTNEGTIELSVNNWMGITVNTGNASADPVTIVFSTSIGKFRNDESTAQVVISQPGGTAYTEFRSTVAGLASLQVYRKDKITISDSLNVAISHSPDKAGQLILQSESNVIPISKDGVTYTVELKATVLTSVSTGGQVVGNAPVVFSIVNPVGGGEFLAPVVVHTDSSGVARSVFTSGTIGSDAKGITIMASLVDNSTVKSHVNLVIGGTPGSISIGIGSQVQAINDATYTLPISILVSDANGNNISGTAVSLNIWPEKYSTGYWDKTSGCNVFFTGIYPNEDINQNLILDPGEDLDGNGKLTPPSSSAGNVPSVVYTNKNGVATFDLVYLKSSMWITARLSASTIVKGSETVSTSSFRLPFIGDDSCYMDNSPYVASNTDVASISIQPALPENVNDPYFQFNAGGISCNNDDISCDGRWTPIIITLQDDSGNLAKDGIPVTVTTTAGSLAEQNALTSNTTPASGGAQLFTGTSKSGKLTLKLFSSDNLGKAIIRVETNNIVKNTIVEFVSGPAAKIIIKPSPVSLPANGEDESEILVTVLDATDNPVSDGETVNISVDYGILNKLVGVTKDGFVTFIYTAPTSLPNNEVANINVILANAVKGSETINLTGPPIAGIDISIEPDTLPMDGVSKATVFATVSLSGGGNVPDGTTVNFSIVSWTADKGSIENTGMTAGGIARAILTAGTTLSPVTVRAESGGRMAELVIKYTQGSMNVSIVPNAILGTGISYASVVAVPKNVTGNVQENAIVIFETDNTVMGGFVEYTTLSSELLSTGGTSRLTAQVINGEARAYFIGSSTGGSVKVLASWDQNINGFVDSNEVSGYDILDIQPPPSFINIAENSPDPSSINIKGTGGLSTSQITFDVKDSSGQLVADGYKILFSINSGPNGGEDIQPLFAYTKDGKVSTIIRSGFKSGPVSIKAVYYYDTSISTNTSQVAINAGPPVGEEFGISSEFLNMSGLSYSFLENKITVNAGDLYGNIIPDNTVISFKTYNTGGLFQPNVSVTQNGIASNTLISTGNNPEPMQGFVYLTAEANNGGRTTRMTCITVTPGNGNNHILYAGTNGGGVYKSSNYGAEWINISRSSVYLGQNVIDPFINDIAVDPVEPNTVFAATGYLGRGNLYRSLDGGLNWNSNNTKEWNGLLSGFNSAVLTVLCDDYKGYSRNIWIGTDGQGILYSKDGGDNFMKLGISEPVNDTVLIVESESEYYSNPNNHGNGYMRRPNLSCGSTEQTWSTEYKVRFQKSDVYTTASIEGDVVIADGVGTESWTVKKNGKLNWVLSNSSSSESYTESINSNKEAYFDETHPISFSIIESQEYTAAHGESFVLYFDGEWDVFASQGGLQGSKAETGIYYQSDNDDVEFLIVSGSVTFGHNDRFSFKAEPGGMGCGKTVKDIVKVPGTNGETAILFAATSTGVFKSVNGGRVWTETKNFLGDTVTTLEVIKRGGSDVILFAGTHDAGVWYSVNNGDDWNQYNDGLGYGLRATTPKADVNNIGNGSVIVTLEDDENTKTETWFIECVKTTLNGGQFSVVGTSSGRRMTATVGMPCKYTEMTLYIIDGDKDYQIGDQFTFRTIRDSGMEIKDLVVYSDPTYTEQRLYAVTYFWGVLEPHAVGCVYSVNLNNLSYVPEGKWTRDNEINGLPPYEPPGDQSLFAQHVLVLNTADDYKSLNDRIKPSHLYIGGEGINFYTTDGLSNLNTGALNWQESNIGLSNLIMARKPVVFTGNCTLSVKEQLLWGNVNTVAYVMFEIYVQDSNGNPPIKQSDITYKLYTYDPTTGGLSGLDPEVIWVYPDAIVSQGTYMDKSNAQTNNPFKVYFLMGKTARYQAVEFEFRPATFIGEGDVIIPPGSSGVDQKTQKFEYY